MRRSWIAAPAASALLLFGMTGPSKADDAKAVEILDKAVKALGGEEKLAKIQAASWKAEGKLTVNGGEGKFNTSVTFQGDDRIHIDFDAEFGGNPIKGSTIVNGDKGWRKFNDNQQDLGADDIAREKRTLYLIVSPALPTRLKGKGFKVSADGEEKVGDKPADVLKIVGPDGKDFRLFFDKESGLPVKAVARVAGWNGEEFEQASLFSDYKDFGGVKRPTKVVSTRDGEPFIEQTVVDFKVEENLPAETFAEPK
ncbi:outer membrane lipoprotein-sorting protein [Paludisphaera borealis]|uniref:Outer membrane lipoprotein carrier protein LolA n=1 Tax=Paludisphaera borealis TaxID=1387353 RepID=A0A1U7CRF6_9BACT|nr:outer membrane lipoprotein-sorting protein [Paludisphaera borealis]APW61488.1 hypothetical protein BSF38_03003 [Paludisphaera borealis]